MEILANSMADGSGTFDVVYTYQSTACLNVCGLGSNNLSAHTYHHTSGTLPGYLTGIEDITLGFWCADPYAPCMELEHADIPTYNYPPTGEDIILYNQVVAVVDDLITAAPLDLAGATCNCGALYKPTGVQWRWDTALDSDHMDAEYKAACGTLYHYRMTPCADGTAFDGYTNAPLTEGSVWIGGDGFCYTATAQDPTEGAVGICGLTPADSCDSEACTGPPEPITYRLEECFGLGLWYFSSTDVIPDGTAACCVFSSTPPMGDPLTVSGKIYADVTPSTSTMASYVTGPSCPGVLPCP